ncbi:MAG: hypothetical protein AB4426_14465 [Xenococcaceae cyanobacterium]
MFGFRQNTAMISGVELPQEFSGCSVINNVAISRDGSKYAFLTPEKRLVVGEVPPDGVIEVNGQRIKISVGKIGSSINEIDKWYEGIARVSLRETLDDVRLELSSDSKVHVQGLTNQEPAVFDDTLHVNRLSGKLSIPRGTEVDFTVSSGDIEGVIASPGRIQATSGDVRLILLAPLGVIAHASLGDIDITGMISEGRGRFIPPGVDPIGILEVIASVGDIYIGYRG